MRPMPASPRPRVPYKHLNFVGLSNLLSVTVNRRVARQPRFSAMDDGAVAGSILGEHGSLAESDSSLDLQMVAKLLESSPQSRIQPLPSLDTGL